MPLDRHLARADINGPGLIAQAALQLGVAKRTLNRHQQVGLDPWTADRYAITAGLHPLAVWGDAWINAVASREFQQTEDC
jgi:hypothetical protein